MARWSATTEGAIGCIRDRIGGRSVLRTMAGHPDRFCSGVALHPSLCTTDEPDSPHLAVPSLTGWLYVGFGAEDRRQAPADNEALIELVQAMPRGEAEIHEGADHGYAAPGPAYHHVGADRSYDRARAILDEAIFGEALR